MITHTYKKEPLVSFIVNCYNGERYLKKCINSILNQTYQNWELIFWDNESTDTSAQIIKSYTDQRIKYFASKKNVTLGQARAWAIEKCQGDYISFLDVDDSWIPEKTAIQVKGMLETNSVLSYGGIIEIIEDTNISKINLPKHKSGIIFSNNLLQFDINMPTSMIKRNTLIEKKLNFDPNISASEEYCLFMQLIVDELVYVIQSPLAIYTVRKNSLTAEKIDRWAFERRYTLNKIKENHPGIENRYRKEFKEAYHRANYYEARYLMSQNRKKEARKVLRKAIFFSHKYFLLFLFLFFPPVLWRSIHILKNKRI